MSETSPSVRKFNRVSRMAQEQDREGVEQMDHFENQFLQWRRRYLAVFLDGHEVDPKNRTRAAIEKMERNEDTKERKFGARAPNKHFFKTVLLPFVQEAETKTQKKKRARDILWVFSRLMQYEQARELSSMDYSILQNFFSLDQQGIFRYFYEKDGKELALVAGQIFSVPFTDEGLPFFFSPPQDFPSRDEIDKLFEPFRIIPRRFRSDAALLYLKTLPRTKLSEDFLKYLEKLFFIFQKEGKEDLFQRYLLLVRQVPYSAIAHTQKEEHDLFSFHAPEGILAQMKALEELPFSEDCFLSAQALIASGVRIAFREETNFFSFGTLLKDLELKGVSKRRQRDIIRIPLRFPGLKDMAHQVMNRSLELKADDIALFQKIKEVEGRFSLEGILIPDEKGSCLPKQWRKFLEIAEQLLSVPEILDVYLFVPRRLKSFIEEYPEELEALVTEALRLSKKIPRIVDLHMEVYAIIFQVVLKAWHHPTKKAEIRQELERLIDHEVKKIPRSLAKLSYDEQTNIYGRLEHVLERFSNHIPLQKDCFPAEESALIEQFMEGNDPSRLFPFFYSLCDHGIDRRFAAHFSFAVSLEKRKRKLLKDIPLPIPKEKFFALVDAYRRFKKAWKKVQQGSSVDEKIFDVLEDVEKQLFTLTEDDEVKVIGNLRSAIPALKNARIAQMVLQFRKGVSLGILHSGLDLECSSLLSKTNDSTKLIIAGASMLAALQKSAPGKELFVDRNQCALALREKGSERKLRENLREIVPRVEQEILQRRSEIASLMAIGAKIHTSGAMLEEYFHLIEKVFGLYSTPFHLIHAGESLVLPPLPSSFEMKYLLRLLEIFQALDPDHPQLQMTIAGRWGNTLAAIVGASVLLSTDVGVSYKRNAFETSHDLFTGRRIMVYDAGVRQFGLPFDLPVAPGRTDMLARRSVQDLDMYQLLGTLATHFQYGGPLKDLMEDYIREFSQILERHQLLPVLDQSAWIAQHAGEGDTARSHERMIHQLTRAWMRASDHPDLGIIGEVKILIEKTRRLFELRRSEIIAGNPEEMDKLLRF